MPVRRSRRYEARRLVAADDALAVDDEGVCRVYSMSLHRRRWQLHVHSSSAMIAALPTSRSLRDETRQLDATGCALAVDGDDV